MCTKKYSLTSIGVDQKIYDLYYMSSLGIEFAIQNGRVLAYCFRNRLSVTLVKGNITLRSSKFIRREENVEVTSQPDQDDLVSGGINYFIS